MFSFYFRTNQRVKLENLIDEFESKSLKNKIIEFNKLGINIIWEVSGRSPMLKLDTNSINKWERELLRIGFENDCELIGWETTKM